MDDVSRIPVGELMTIPEAAAHLGVTRGAVYGAIGRGALTPIVVLGNRRLRRSEVEGYRPQGLQGRRASKNAPDPGAPARRRGRPPKQTADSPRAVDAAQE